jgi:hypothetical protein
MGFRRRRLHKAEARPSEDDPLSEPYAPARAPGSGGVKQHSAALALGLLIGTVLLIVFAAELLLKMHARNG